MAIPERSARVGGFLGMVFWLAGWVVYLYALSLVRRVLRVRRPQGKHVRPVGAAARLLAHARSQGKRAASPRHRSPSGGFVARTGSEVPQDAHVIEGSARREVR